MSYTILLAFFIFPLITGIFYAVTPQRYRYIILLAASAAAIIVFSKWLAVCILATITTTWAAGRIMERISSRYSPEGLEKKERKKLKEKIKGQKKKTVIVYIAFNLGILIIMKYFNFMSRSLTSLLALFDIDTEPVLLHLALPLGISYYTLQALSYVVDVYRGKYPAERNLLKIALFICFLPQLHEGPFGRYDALMPAMSSGRQITVERVYDGAARMLWGLFKIFLVANRAAIIADAVFAGSDRYGGWVILLGGAAFTLQLYAEFSGYIDIASGISAVFGIDLARNFNLPFLSRNVAEFWRRWHISLGTFFRDYVFYPVSASRMMKALTGNMSIRTGSNVNLAVSLLIVWLLTGLWHGASWKYVCYGLYYFLLILLFNLLSPGAAKLLVKLRIKEGNVFINMINTVKTVILVVIGMTLFRAQNVTEFIRMVAAFFKGGEDLHITLIMELPDIIVLVAAVLILVAGGLLELRDIDIRERRSSLKPYQQYLVCFFFFCVIMVFGAYGLDYAAPDPIYGGF